MSGRAWADAMRAAGAVPASYVPEGSLGRTDLEEVAGAEAVENAELRVHPADAPGLSPPAASFLDGLQYWKVVFYDGVLPIVHVHVACAVRRRGADRKLRTADHATRDFHLAHLAGLKPAVRRLLDEGGLSVVDLPDGAAAQPGRAQEAARRAVENARVALEKEVGERCAARLGPDEWLVQDGLLSESAVLSGHPRALGVIKSHGAQYFEGPELERALTIPAGHRTSVFRPRGRARHEVYSWYLRLWPWEGNDLLFGLLRIEARAHPDTVARASAISGWLVRERAPLSTPDARWDRLLYPIHDVESYLKALAPRDLLPAPASRLPKTGT
ncbi:MAG: hypothetical protein HYS40_09530 [Gemmatimonadetes bacterium]|nr:hypothetical protein [Gemmatimonadota bacterium]